MSIEEEVKEQIREELSGYRKIGKATVEGHGNDLLTVYLKPSGDIEFVDKSLSWFLILPPERIFPECQEVWWKIFNGRGWYAVKKANGNYYCRFNVH